MKANLFSRGLSILKQYYNNNELLNQAHKEYMNHKEGLLKFSEWINGTVEKKITKGDAKWVDKLSDKYRTYLTKMTKEEVKKPFAEWVNGYIVLETYRIIPKSEARTVMVVLGSSESPILLEAKAIPDSTEEPDRMFRGEEGLTKEEVKKVSIYTEPVKKPVPSHLKYGEGKPKTEKLKGWEAIIQIVKEYNVLQNFIYALDLQQWYEQVKVNSVECWLPVKEQKIIVKIKNQVDEYIEKNTVDKKITLEGKTYSLFIPSTDETSCRKALKTIEITKGFCIEQFERKPGYLYFLDGVLNLETMEKLDYVKFTQVKLPYSIRSVEAGTKLENEKIFLWLVERLGKQYDLAYFICIAIHLTLTGNTRMQMFMEIFGPAKTGKSTLFTIIEAIVGQNNQVVTSIEDLESNKFELARLKDKLLITIPDAPKFIGLGNTLKKITGEDSLRFEKKHRDDDIVFKVIGLIWISTNSRMEFTDESSGVSRRRMLIELTNPIINSEPVFKYNNITRNYEGSLEPHLTSFIAAIIRLKSEVERIIKNKEKILLKEFPNLSINENKQLIIENPMAEFVVNGLVYLEGAFVPLGGDQVALNLYDAYLLFCKKARRSPTSKARFSVSLISVIEQKFKLTITKTRSGSGVFIKGLAILSADRRYCSYYTSMGDIYSRATVSPLSNKADMNTNENITWNSWEDYKAFIASDKFVPLHEHRLRTETGNIKFFFEYKIGAVHYGLDSHDFLIKEISDPSKSFIKIDRDVKDTLGYIFGGNSMIQPNSISTNLQTGQRVTQQILTLKTLLTGDLHKVNISQFPDFPHENFNRFFIVSERAYKYFISILDQIYDKEKAHFTNFS